MFEIKDSFHPFILNVSFEYIELKGKIRIYITGVYRRGQKTIKVIIFLQLI